MRTPRSAQRCGGLFFLEWMSFAEIAAICGIQLPKGMSFTETTVICNLLLLKGDVICKNVSILYQLIPEKGCHLQNSLFLSPLCRLLGK